MKKLLYMKKLLSLLLVLCLFTGGISALATEDGEEIASEEEITEEEVDNEDYDIEDASDILNEEEIEKNENAENTENTDDKIIDENLNLTDEEAVKKDSDALSLGFLKCVSRNLNFVAEGKNGSRILWKSSHPHIISDKGKFTAPKKITDVTITATITKGKAKATKKFTATANSRSMYDLIVDYVDTMCEYGRDTKYFNNDFLYNFKDDKYSNYYEIGNRVEIVTSITGRNTIGRKSGLFFGMLDRDTLQYPGYYVTEWPRETYNSDERNSGCEVSPEVYLYEIMYDLTAMTGEKRYEEIADGVFAFLLDHLILPDNGVLVWGKHMIYDPITATFNTPNQYATSEEEVSAQGSLNEAYYGQRYLMRIPFFIHKMFETDPEATHQHLLSWYSTTLANYKDFSFGRHTNLDSTGTVTGNYLQMLDPMLYAYAWGYHYTGDPQFMEALYSLMNWVERLGSIMNENDVITQELYYGSNRPRSAWMFGQQLLVSHMIEVMPLVPENIRERMERFIEKNEKFFYADTSKGKSSFLRQVYLRTGQPSQFTSPVESWGYIYTWEDLPEGEFRDKLTEWLTWWADKYGFDNLESRLTTSEYMPFSLADEMEFLRILYEGTGNEKYLDRALELADFAIYDLWEMESLLPAMTHAQKKYYDSGWGCVKVVGEIWKAYFDGVERDTGIHPVNVAWEKAGYMTKEIGDYWNKELYEKTKFKHEIGGEQNEE